MKFRRVFSADPAVPPGPRNVCYGCRPTTGLAFGLGLGMHWVIIVIISILIVIIVIIIVIVIIIIGIFVVHIELTWQQCRVCVHEGMAVMWPVSGHALLAHLPGYT